MCGSAGVCGIHGEFYDGECDGDGSSVLEVVGATPLRLPDGDLLSIRSRCCS